MLSAVVSIKIESAQFDIQGIACDSACAGHFCITNRADAIPLRATCVAQLGRRRHFDACP